jgi:PQ loop repeat
VNLPQIRINAEQGHTGQLAPATVAMRLLGSAMRVLTTVQDLGLVVPLLFSYSLSVVLNAVLLVQCWMYREQTAKLGVSFDDAELNQA